MINGYDLARVNLVRAGCPYELSQLPANCMHGVPIVIERNRHNYGYIAATKYAPEAVVVAGAARRSALLGLGVVKSWAFVQAGAITINADDKMSCDELMTALGRALDAKYRSPTSTMNQTMGLVSPSPWIVQVYPFENYFIYRLKEDLYRQAYTIDPVERKVTLSNEPKKVVQKYIDAATGSGQMPDAQTGARSAVAPVVSPKQTYSQGAKNSELVISLIRDWRNINKAIQDYLDTIRNGATRKPPAFQPVALTSDGKINALLNASGVDPFAFAVWTAQRRGL